MSGRALTIKTLVLASGKALGALSAVLLTAVLTRTLSMQQYATHKQALLLFAMASPLLMLGLPKALYYFLPGEPKRARAALFENLGLLALLGLVFAAALLLGGIDLAAERFANPALADAARWVAPYGLAMFPMAALGACLVARDRVVELVRFNIVSRALLVALAAGAALLWGNAEATVAAHAAWGGVMLVPALWMMRRAVRPPPAGSVVDSHAIDAISDDSDVIADDSNAIVDDSNAIVDDSDAIGDDSDAIADDSDAMSEPPLPARPTTRGMARQLRFAVPLGLASLLGTLSAQLDKLIVSAMCATEDFAIYATGAIELPLIGVVTGAMSAVVLPELTRFYKAGTPGRIVDLWQRALETALLILAPVMFGVLLTAPELMTVLFSATYAEAATPLRIYALLLPLRAAVYGSVLMATDNTRWVTASAAFGLLLNGVLSVVAVGLFGYAGAAWATVLTTYGVVAFMLFPMGRALAVRPDRLLPWRRMAVVLAGAGLPALVVLALVHGLSAPTHLADWPAALRLVVVGGSYVALTALVYQVTGIARLRALLDFVRRR